MNTTCKASLTFGSSLALAAFLGTQLGEPTALAPATPAPSSQANASVRPVTMPSLQAAPAASADNSIEPVLSTTLDAPTKTLAQLRLAWAQAHTLEQLEPIAQAIAEHDSAESTQLLLDGIDHIKEWSVRAALAKNLRAISSPDTLQALLPALLNNYGRGNTILNEISDTIARIAQPETVEALAALHWQASVQAGQGHKVLRTVASIRNPIATRGLMKVASNTESPALAAAASEALKAMRGEAANAATL